MIRVGLTERHGMAVEQSLFPPDGVGYSFLSPTRLRPRVVRSPIKAFMRSYDARDVDVIEAIISPIVTGRPWIYSCETFPAATAFSLWRVPLPRAVRVAFIRRLLLKNNCKKVLFWSQAGLRSLQSYAGLDPSDALYKKAVVVYPAVRRAPDRPDRPSNGEVTLLFTGDFFRKGGVNVIDAFERAHKVHRRLKLVVCCDEKIDFNTPNLAMRQEYLGKVHNTEGVESLGRISRDRLLGDILPRCDGYLLPTYAETFGMSILEAMAFGVPVVATNHFAIPEVVIHGESGLLIDISAFNTDRLFRGYVVDHIPDAFRQHVTDRLFEYLCLLAESAETRQRLAAAACQRARTEFSFEARNLKMAPVYREAAE